MKVYKHIFEVTILNERQDYNPPLASGEDDDGLESMIYDITEGDSIGIVRKLGAEELEPEQLRAELLAMGNDGDFFNEEDS